jgi:4'-phosphopantetheinyl transferase
MAHSGTICLYAVANRQRVGVDIEKIRAGVDCEEIGGLVFSPAELAFCRAADGRQKSAAFFQCWTRREAYLKAVGVGLSGVGRTMDIHPRSPGLGRVEVLNVAAGGFPWTLVDLAPAPDYAAAAAIEGRCAELTLWDMDGRVPHMCT